MRQLSLWSVIAWFATASPGVHATFSVGRVVSTPQAAVVATVQPRTGAPGYRWVRVYFYAAPLSPADQAAAARGRTRAIAAAWQAALQVSIDRDGTVWQIDLSLPGHTCTVAALDGEARSELSRFQFDGARLQLTGKSVHTCSGDTLGWDVAVDTPVVAAALTADR